MVIARIGDSGVERMARTTTMDRLVLGVVADLNGRGMDLVRDGEFILVRPSKFLTDRDRTKIRKLKPHILRFLDRMPKGVH